MATGIAAPPKRVWRAITDPDELGSWNPSVLEIIDAPTGAPKIGHRLRCRYSLRGIPIVLSIRTTGVTPGRELRSTLRLGALQLDLRYSLEPEIGDPPRARLGMRLDTTSNAAVEGEILDRFEVRSLATQFVATSLEGVRKWCEQKEARLDAS